MYVCIYVCMYICIYICMYVYIYIYVYMYVCIYVCIYVFYNYLFCMLHYYEVILHEVVFSYTISIQLHNIN